ncbi:MAG: hypothetical protein IT580_06365 [Verrucomicrobiales bacterium]|nr:hypothetical protein [Verrucomicrobiales bacterium]
MADITVPLGHGMMGGAWKAVRVVDPLEVHGWVLLSDTLPIVFASLDWCELRNEGYHDWQAALARAAMTTPDRVMLTTVHQHDAPVVDPGAERLLRARRLEGSVCDPAFHQLVLERVAAAVRRSLSDPIEVTHLGHGQAQVERVASNRRYLMPDGGVRFDRTSATRNAFAIEAGEGVIDPILRTLSFWSGDVPLSTTSFYAVHPMSYYGQGEVSADFPGIARRLRETQLPGCQQIYASGASGNVTAGKYNSGARENRAVLAGRLADAMSRAWDTTRRVPISAPGFRSSAVTLPVRDSAGFDAESLEGQLRPGVAPFKQCLAAMGLSWRERVATGRPIAVPCLDFGEAALVVLPGESYVEFQLLAQSLRPEAMVCVAGYGDGATGYVPTERHREEGDANLADWCWVGPGSERNLTEALRAVLRPR